MPKLSEIMKVEEAVTPQDIATADVTSAYYPVAQYRRVAAVLTTQTIAATQNATVQLLQAEDDQGLNARPLGALVEKIAGAGGETLIVTAEAHVDELDDGCTHVAVQVGSDDPNAVPPEGAAILVFAEPRFAPVR